MPTTAAAAAALADMASARQHGKTYPEWDVYRKHYRPDWCTVGEIDTRPADDAALAAPDVHALRRPLARLGTGLDHCRRQFAGDDIDIDATVEARVDVLAGAPRDQPVYVDTLRRRRDLAVLVLLDISASAAEPGTGSKTVHEQQRAAASMLTTALHGLGDRVALYGFYSQGRTAVRLVRVKGFDDDLGTLEMRRLGGLVPGAYTRLGAAIRHGAAMLEDRGGASRRLLVVLSDGLAYDHGYEGPYGEADSRRALAEARRRGTGCLCLSVGAGTGLASLRQVFGTAAHASIARPDQLSGVVGPLFRAALGSAELRRRKSQREVQVRSRLTAERRTA
jgi:nitric oxide reductase activation protein